MRTKSREPFPASEALTWPILEDLPTIVWATDSDLRFTSFLGAGLTILNLRPEQVVGKSLAELFQSDAPDFPMIAAHHRAVRGESISCEQDWAGSVYRVRVDPLLDEAGRIVGCIGVAQNAAEQQKHQRALHRAQDELERRVADRTSRLAQANAQLRHEIKERRQGYDQLQTIYDGMVEGLLIMDIKTRRFMRVNSSLCRMLGYSEEELLALSIKDIHPPEGVPNELERFETTAEGRVSTNEARPVLRKDASLFYADITGRRILYDGRPCLLALFRDITERKQAQDALKRHQEMAIAEAFAWQRGTELAEEARRKDEFLAMLAHELRNPLAPLRNGIEVLRIVPPNGEQTRQILDMMEEQTTNLVRLIDDLLDASRCTRGKLELRPQRVALSKIITIAVQTAQPLVRANGHELVVTQAPEVLYVRGDPTRLTQVVSNLLNNAAKYTHSGGKILLTTEKIGNEAVIRVEDNGSGIASDMLPRIFELFVQADNSLNRTQGGLGIGLTLVKSLVEMHGGTVEATSDGLGKGSQFTVRLPLLRTNDVVPEEAIDAPGEKRSFPSHTILIVDDVQPAAFLVATLLRRHWGQRVRTASSGAEALAMIEQEKPELILSDISMPEMNGHELAQEIRRRPEWNDICLVAVTGYGQESDKRLAMEAGFNSHVVKPISNKDLERLLVSLPNRR